MSTFKISTLEDFLHCGKLLHKQFEIEALRAAIRTFREISTQMPDQFAQLYREFSLNLGQPFQEWLKSKHPLMSADDRYTTGMWMSCAAITAGKSDLAMDFWSAHLVTERPPKHDDLIGISAVSANNYDCDPRHYKAASELVRLALMLSPQPLNILDLCCGTGLHTEYLTGIQQSITGIDLELSGLKQAGRTSKYTHLIEGDVVAEMGRLDGKYDLIILGGATYFFSDLDWLFRHTARLLHPHGLLVFNGCPCSDSDDWLITPSGTFRYCHSSRYLQSIAKTHQLIAKWKSWQIVYDNLPNLFWAFTPAPAIP